MGRHRTGTAADPACGGSTSSTLRWRTTTPSLPRSSNAIRPRSSSVGAESRSHRRYGGSLNQLVDDGDGNKIEMGATLPEDQQSMHTGTRFRSGEELHDLATDIARLIADLPPEVADICERLKRDTISVVARDLGMPRSTLHNLLKGVRSRFESCDMREYL